MKKIIIGLLVVVSFVLGIIFSDDILKGINTIFSTEFLTKTDLEKRLEQSEKKNEVFKKKIDDLNHTPYSENMRWSHQHQIRKIEDHFQYLHHQAAP